MKAGQYAHRDRRVKKREFRKLWIARINAAARLNGISYSKLICGLTKAGVAVDRKMMAELAVNDAQAFAKLVAVGAHGRAPAASQAQDCAYARHKRLRLVSTLRQCNPNIRLLTR